MATEKARIDAIRPVTTDVCKLITDATNEKIAAQKVLFDAEMRGFKNIVIASVTTATTLLAVLEIFLKLWHP